MATRELYHGTSGDRLLSIIAQGQVVPSDGKVFFARFNWASVLQHGADRKRKVALAARLEVDVPDTAGIDYVSTPGCPDTMVVRTATPLPARVLELIVRSARANEVERFHGEEAIKQYLGA